jgi:hypothetical protein
VARRCRQRHYTAWRSASWSTTARSFSTAWA